MKAHHIGIVLAAALAITGCSKKTDKAAPTSGLAWTPDNYSAMTDKCKKALACCEDAAKADGAKSAEDFNGKCSGPALWKDDECETDLKARASGADGKPVPASCK